MSPRPVRDGLKARTQRGSFSQTWWGRRWIEALEGFGWDTRLARGRSYARRGQVVDLDVAPGEVSALVQGSQSKPYRVRIGLAPLAEEQWAAAFEALAREAGHSAWLLAGELPEEVEPIFAAAGSSLFPARANDLEMRCSCPDWAVPCKHVAAVHYLLAEEIDRDPFLLFMLRGKEREAVLEGLRHARGTAHEGGISDLPDISEMPDGSDGPGQSTATVEPLPVEGFWESPVPLKDWRVAPAPPTVPGAVLRRLGSPDFASEPGRLQRLLDEIYARVSHRALAASVEGGAPDSDEGNGG
jgi:uncharacterized Zn finger protein